MCGSPSVTCIPELSFPLTRESDGASADVIDLGLYGSVGGIQQYELSGWLPDALVFSREACRVDVEACGG